MRHLLINLWRQNISEHPNRFSCCRTFFSMPSLATDVNCMQVNLIFAALNSLKLIAFCPHLPKSVATQDYRVLVACVEGSFRPTFRKLNSWALYSDYQSSAVSKENVQLQLWTLCSQKNVVWKIFFPENNNFSPFSTWTDWVAPQASEFLQNLED